MTRRRSAERGFTMVELMVAMVVAAVVVWAVLANQVRMMSAYHREDSVATIRATLAAAQAEIATDIRMAGYLMPDGFKTAAFGTPDLLVPPLSVVNNAGNQGPDVLRIYHAGAGRAVRVLAFDGARQSATVEDVGDFAIGDLVALVNPRLVAAPGGGTEKVVTYDACVVKVTAVLPAAATIEFRDGAPPYNTATNDHCADVAGATLAEAPRSETLLVGFVARSYRIDPARRRLGVLQVSPSGELASGDFTDIGVAFVDLQVATRYFEAGDGADADGDGDAARDWYSSEAQETPDPTAVRPMTGIVSEVSVSFVMRTSEMTTGVASAATPDLSAPPSLAHNPIGDAPSIDLSTMPVASRPEAYRGDFLYRAITTRVEARNLGARP